MRWTPPRTASYLWLNIPQANFNARKSAVSDCPAYRYREVCGAITAFLFYPNNASASAPAAIRIGEEGSVAADHTACATSFASVTGAGFPHSAKIFCASSAYASGMAPCIRDCAFSPKRVVGARPGSTRFTRTLNCSSSRASDSVNALTAALLAVYTDSKGRDFSVTDEVTLMMTPALRCLNCGNTA